MPNDAAIRFLPAASPLEPDAFFRPGAADAPVVVSVHGISRNAAEHALRLARVAAFDGLSVLCPLFEKARFGRYQQLHPGADGGRADEGLLRLLDRLATEGRIPDRPILLTGFSGGAQFAHRFAASWPDRVARLAPVAAGWYLWPDPALAWPEGPASPPAGLPPPDVRRLLAIPTRVICGTRDRRSRDGAFRSSPDLDARQGRSRIGRARRWVAAMQDAAHAAGVAADIAFVPLPGAGHDFGAAMMHFGLGEAVAFGLLDIAAAPSCGSGCLNREGETVRTVRGSETEGKVS